MGTPERESNLFPPKFWSPMLVGRAALHLRQQESGKRPDDPLSSLR